ncbi:hypothetical protein EAG_03129 [Camponotus floridanus]|uniref:Equilibrative nucleoside transporter 1 n=1 Tax=Camponotus floridanus TaxID=104421 RepID=E2ATB6_CAMFO|nr:hypothetical protein EAG_03129 [Camponotus floridanus]
MFITAKEYFVSYKLSKEYTGVDTNYATNFLANLGFAAQIPNLLFNWLNVFLQLGGNLTTRIVWSIFPSQKYLVIPVVLRLAYIPLFLLCNYQPAHVERSLPIFIDNDWIFWIIAITMGFSSGYLSSLSMMYCPRMVDSQHAATAGMFGAASLITGLFTGILFSMSMPSLVANITF